MIGASMTNDTGMTTAAWRQEAWDVLVGEPFESTFRRPLGDF